MKHFLTLILVFCSLSLFAQQYKYGQNGHNGFVLKSQTRDAVNIGFHIDGFSLVDSPEKDVDGKNISLPGVFMPNTPGAPDLPSKSTYVAIPNGSTVEMEICHVEKDIIHNVDLAPAAELLPDNSTEHPSVAKDLEIYSKDAFYPENPIVLNGVSDIRKVQVAQIGIMPFQYNPVTKELIVYHDIEIKLHIDGGDGHFGIDRYRTPEWDNILSDLLLNPDVLPTIDRGEQLRKHYENRETGCEYLIVTPDNDEYVSLAQRIQDFRIKQGVPTEVMTINQCGGNDCNEFNNFLQNAYNTWDMPPAALLLIGDHLNDGTKGLVSYRLDNHYEYNPYWSDVPYGDMNGDFLLDLAIGRISMENQNDLEVTIMKDIDYETNPPTDFNFYNEPFTAAGYQYDLWTLMTGEIINGFWEKELGKRPKHLNAIVYEGWYPAPNHVWSERDHTSDIVGYFGEHGFGYIPDNLDHLTDFNTNEQRIADAINSGAFISQFRDHGEANGWFCPPFHRTDLNRLHNTNLTYMMSNGCNIGRIAGTTSLMEDAMRMNQGALGMLATVCVSYGAVQDVYLYGFYDHLWPNFMPDYGTTHPNNFLLPAFANVSANYYFEGSSYVGNDFKEFSHCLFHHYGDVYMNLYSEVPRQIEVSNDLKIFAQSSIFDITVEEGTNVCLTVDGAIIGYGIGTGQPQQIEIVPQTDRDVLVTLTKQNCYRQEITLTPLVPATPHISLSGFEIDDTEGDNDHQADNNEECFINVTIKDIGEAEALAGNATISCSSPLVTILEGTASFPALAPDEEFLIDHVFKVFFDGHISDGTTIPFHLDITTGDFVFEAQFSVIVNAPVLELSAPILTNFDGDTLLSIPTYGKALLSFDLINRGNQQTSEVVTQISSLGNFVEIEPVEPITQIDAHGSHHFVSLINAEETPFDQAILPFQINSTFDFGEITVETFIPYGNITEDFESEELNDLDFKWTQSSNKQWFRDNGDAFSGEYSFRSATDLPSYGTSQLGCTIIIDKPETVSFYYKISAKDNDKLRISCNSSTPIFECSGETEWQKGTIELQERENTIIFKYKKNGIGTAGEDCARIDFIQLPPKAKIIISAGDDLNSCLDDSITPNSVAYFHDHIHWTTDGDGYFENDSVVVPTYIPGENDKANLHVDLIMSAFANNLESETDSISVNFIEDLSEYQPEMAFGDTLVDIRLTQQSTFLADNNEIFAWSLEPNEAGTLAFEGPQAIVNWKENFVGQATLTYQTQNECSTSDNSMPLQIRVINSFGIDENEQSKLEIYPNPASDKLHVKMNEIQGEEVIIQLVDIFGKIVFHDQITLHDGHGDMEISVKPFTSGVYYLQILDDSSTINKAIIVK